MPIKRIVAIGASTCEGVGDPGGGGYVGRLRSWFCGLDTHHHVFNLGISGQTSRDVCSRLLNECVPRRPDLIIIQMGGNDAARLGPRLPTTLTAEQQEKNRIAMIQAALSLTPHILLLQGLPIDETRTTPVSWKEMYYFAKDMQETANITAQVAEELRVPLIEAAIHAQNENVMSLLASDGLHPNAKGHQHLFELLKTYLVQAKLVEV